MKKVFFVLLGVLLLYGCPTSRKISKQNLSYIYRRNNNFLHPSYAVYHENDSTSRLHFKIDSEELLYTRQGIDQEFTATIRISYTLTSSYETIDLLDSASVSVTDVNGSNVHKEIIGSIDMKVKQGATYLLHVQMTDTRRNQSSESYISIDKLNRQNRQNFIALAPSDNVPLFRNYISSTEEVKVMTRENTNRLFVRYYKRGFPVAAPPYSIVVNKNFQYKADSTFTLQLDEQHSALVKLPQPGFYHFQADTSLREGFTLFRFKEPFPEIGAAGQLVTPLIYITTSEEYENLLKQPNSKAAADDFWLTMTGSRERAKEVIRKFYNRVQDANMLFTSYTEGWKTDRGMIYIIYGPPGTVYRSNNTEIWIYGEDKMVRSGNFIFEHSSNPFTDNDYTLDRMEEYKPGWQSTINVWRQGRVYID